MRHTLPETFKKRQLTIERVNQLTGRQARIALLRLLEDIRMCPRITAALDIAETYPKEP